MAYGELGSTSKPGGNDRDGTTHAVSPSKDSDHSPYSMNPSLDQREYQSTFAPRQSSYNDAVGIGADYSSFNKWYKYKKDKFMSSPSFIRTSSESSTPNNENP